MIDKTLARYIFDNINVKEKDLNNIPKKYLDKLSIKKVLGIGAEGIVFDIGDNKVLKISNIDKSYHKDHTKENFNKVFRKIKNKKNIISLIDKKFLSEKSFYYVSNKLYKLSFAESQFLDNCVCQNLSNYLFDLTDKQLIKYKKLIDFIRNVTSDKDLIICDVVSFNVMKDKNGNYFMIDLGFVRIIPNNKK